MNNGIAEFQGRIAETHQSSTQWVEATEHVDPSFGGVCAILPQFAESVTQAGGSRVCVAGFCGEGEGWPGAPSRQVQLERFPLSSQRWLFDRALRERFDKLIAGADGVHIHGLWRPHCMISAHAARKHRKPYLISAHGMLERWALGNKRVKKIIYSLLVERRNLRHADCLHALTRAEAGDYRRLGLRNPVAVIPNGVKVPEAASAEPFFAKFPALRQYRLVLFLGRIHPKKGLDILCRSWREVSRRQPDAHLVLAGPDFENTRARLERLIQELGIADRVTFTGMLSGEPKWSALAAADLFTLPSYSEGFSVSVLEALGMGKPIIVSAQCNFPELSGMGCGWVIQPDVQELEAAFADFFKSSASQKAAMGESGKLLVRSRYGWDVVGAQMAEVYDWLLGGPRPATVEVVSR